MSANKKVRSDSVLKNLPEERQEQIIEWCEMPKSESCPGGYQFAREQLHADGLKVSVTALSSFYSWWQLRKLYQDAEHHSEEQEKLMLTFDPNDLDRARKFGKFCFIQKAMKAQDAKTFLAVERAVQDDQAAAMEREKLDFKKVIEPAKLEQMRRRIDLLEAKQAEAKAALTKVASKGGLTPETQKEIEQALSLL